MESAVGSGNAADLGLRRADEDAGRPALISGTEVVSFGALRDRVAAYVDGLSRAGFRPGDRVAVLLPVSLELYALTLALLASGVTAVFVEARRARQLLRPALEGADVHAVVSVRRLLRWRFFLPALWGRRLLCADGSSLFAESLDRLRGHTTRPKHLVNRDASDVALITFTSGSRGTPRGIARTHGQLIAQARALSAAFPEPAGTVDLPAFPMAAFHNLSCGDTTVLSGADPGRGDGEADAYLSGIEAHGVTRLSGPPAFFEALLTFMERTGRRVHGVRRITVGGAPVGASQCERLLRAFPAATGYVLYGATEAEPIARALMTDVLTAEHDGYLVGRPTPGVEVVVEGSSRPDLAPAAQGEVGEVLVRGRHVGRGDGAWHRTGDLGRLDDEGRLWLLGPVGSEVLHRGRLLQPFALEAAAERVAGVRRTALVAHARAPQGELVVDLHEDAMAEAVLRSLGRLLRARGLGELEVAFAPISVDDRHASKIDRAALRTLRARA